MDFQRSDLDEPPAPFPPPPPPSFWLQQQPPPPPPQPQSSYCNFTEQRTTRDFSLSTGYRNPGLGLDNDYLNNVENTGQGIGRATGNFPIFDNIHKEIQRDLENETRKTGCINPGFGIGRNVKYFGQGTGRANRNVDMLYDVDPETQRDIEKEKIREEIVAAEMARRRELEAEVREELRIERELALRMKGGNAFDKVRVSMEKSLKQEAEEKLEKLAMYAEEKLSIQGRTETKGMDLLPFQRKSLESKVNETHQEKAKAFVSAKTNGYTVFGVWGVRNIEGKKDWRCFICQVSATSEMDLKQHFNGIKHKSKRDALKAEKAALLLTAPPIVAAKPLDGNTVSMLPEKNKAKGSEKFAFWCDMCNEGTNNKYVMEAHKKGTKHLNELQKKIATSEANLKFNFNGNKHKSKRDALKSEVLLPTAPPIVAAKPLDRNSVSMLPEKNKAQGSEKFAFWCNICNAGAKNEYAMEAHKKGKKHLNQLKKKFEFWCDMCKVGAHQANIMEAHLRGKKHSSLLQEKAASRK